MHCLVMTGIDLSGMYTPLSNDKHQNLSGMYTLLSDDKHRFVWYVYIA